MVLTSNILTVEVDVLRERVVVVVRLVRGPHVVVVGDRLFSVGVVRVSGLNSATKNLIKEQLSHVGLQRFIVCQLFCTFDVEIGVTDNRAADHGAVRGGRGVDVSHNVLVRRATFVMSRKDRIKLRHPLIVGVLDTTEKGAVQTSLAIRYVYTGVRSCGVGLIQSVLISGFIRLGGTYSPDINVKVRYRLAGVNVDELEIKVEGNTRLILSNIAANELAEYIIFRFC